MFGMCVCVFVYFSYVIRVRRSGRIVRFGCARFLQTHFVCVSDGMHITWSIRFMERGRCSQYDNIQSKNKMSKKK